MHAVGSESTSGGWCVCSAHAAGGGYTMCCPCSVCANLECSVRAVCMHLEAGRGAFVMMHLCSVCTSGEHQDERSGSAADAWGVCSERASSVQCTFRECTSAVQCSAVSQQLCSVCASLCAVCARGARPWFSVHVQRVCIRHAVIFQDVQPEDKTHAQCSLILQCVSCVCPFHC